MCEASSVAGRSRSVSSLLVQQQDHQDQQDQQEDQQDQQHGEIPTDCGERGKRGQGKRENAKVLHHFRIFVNTCQTLNY